MDRKVVDPSWRYDFGHLYDLICPSEVPVGRSILFGSRPPDNDSLWEVARSKGFEVEVFDRNRSNREKQVDVSLSTTMMEDSYEYMKPERTDKVVLVSGDNDFAPTVRSLARRGIPTVVVFWEHATGRELRAAAESFSPLDPHLSLLEP